MNRRRTRASIASAIVLFAGAASADPPKTAASPTMSNEMRSDYFFRSGEKKFDSGRYAEACADFSESLRLGPKLGTLLNLALCHETVGKRATAWREFHHAAAWAAQNNQKDRHEFAVQHALALETKLPRALLQLPAGSAIDTVEIDGEPIPDSRWYLPLFLDPGEHAVAVSAPGKQRTTVKFRVIDSPTEQLVSVPSLADEGAPPAAPPPPPPSPPAAPEPPSSRRLAGWIALGASGVGLVVGSVAGIVAIRARDDASGHCTGNVCDAAGASSWRDARTWAAVSTVGFATFAIAGGAGAWLLLGGAPAKKSAARVGVAPRPGGAALAVGGVF